MTNIVIDKEKIIVRLAANDSEIRAAQKLRYSVFFDECKGIPSPEVAAEQRDFDDYDHVADHLIVIDTRIQGDTSRQVVGTYRLIRQEAADKVGQFYTHQEYDIAPILGSKETLLELGRSCVLPDYRTRPVLQKLWEGIAKYVADHEIGLIFGCASFPGIDPDALADQLSYLYHNHLAPEELRPRTRDAFYVNMNRVANDTLNPRQIFAKLPPLLKGYMRIGATVGDGAYIDRAMNTTDVCIVLPTHLVTESYLKHYQRKTDKPILNETQRLAREKTHVSAHGTES